MTTIITRLYADDAAAQAVVSALVSGGIGADSIHVIGTADPAAMVAAQVAPQAANAYSAAMTGGQALIVVAVGFNPMGAARKAIKIVGRTPSISCGVAEENAYVQEAMDPAYANRILKGAPLMLTNSYGRMPQGHIFGSNPILASRPRTSAIRGGAYMSKMFWPMKLVSTSRTSTSAISGGMLMSRMFGLATIYHR